MHIFFCIELIGCVKVSCLVIVFVVICYSNRPDRCSDCTRLDFSFLQFVYHRFIHTTLCFIWTTYNISCIIYSFATRSWHLYMMEWVRRTVEMYASSSICLEWVTNCYMIMLNDFWMAKFQSCKSRKDWCKEKIAKKIVIFIVIIE